MTTRAALGERSPEIHVSGGDLIVAADADMLRAVLLNVLLNACEADAGSPSRSHSRPAKVRR